MENITERHKTKTIGYVGLAFTKDTNSFIHLALLYLDLQNSCEGATVQYTSDNGHRPCAHLSTQESKQRVTDRAFE